MITRQHWPVIVVGAGPTGLTLACLLARYGIEVLVVERNPQTVQEPRAVSIDDESLRTMQAVGIINATGAADRARLRLGIFLARPAGGFSRSSRRRWNTAIRGATLFGSRCSSGCLREHLDRLSNASISFETELVEFSQSAEAVTARVRRAGEITELKCDYLVGCDGSSQLRPPEARHRDARLHVS